MIHINTGAYISSPRPPPGHPTCPEGTATAHRAPPRGFRPAPGASQQLNRALPRGFRPAPEASKQLTRRFRPTALSSSELPPKHHTPLTSHSSSRKGRLPLAPTSTTAAGPIRSRGKVERTHLTIEETGVKRRTSYRSAHTRRQSRPNPTMPKQDNTYWFYNSAELMHL